MLEDGTYKVQPNGDLVLQTLTHGYTVGIRPVEPNDVLDAGTLIGKWTDNHDGNSDFDGEYREPVVYWDEVEIIESLLEAGNVARQRGELAIWDNLNNCEIRV